MSKKKSKKGNKTKKSIKKQKNPPLVDLVLDKTHQNDVRPEPFVSKEDFNEMWKKAMTPEPIGTKASGKESDHLIVANSTQCCGGTVSSANCCLGPAIQFFEGGGIQVDKDSPICFSVTQPSSTEKRWSEPAYYPEVPESDPLPISNIFGPIAFVVGCLVVAALIIYLISK